ncbi:hypothetical protein UC8_54960 [Roseimaritima ulvae]|uniref:Molecular chaperone DnaJ n=1 Tax=Roseimaritima ulvae TaxID=980254 RepID=A0A5B9QWQ3_9BACT|nr:hypothetical protein UC8_54960 [Roseimaritima ulvae]
MQTCPTCCGNKGHYEKSSSICATCRGSRTLSGGVAAYEGYGHQTLMCPRCGGSGSTSTSTWVDCGHCRGKGKIASPSVSKPNPTSPTRKPSRSRPTTSSTTEWSWIAAIIGFVITFGCVANALPDETEFRWYVLSSLGGAAFFGRFYKVVWAVFVLTIIAFVAYAIMTGNQN